MAEDKRSIEEQLASLGFYDLRYNCPTNGAIVLFGNNPERYLHGSYIQYVRFVSTRCKFRFILTPHSGAS